MRLLRLVRGQHVDLFVAMHRVPQAQARTQLQVARLEHPFKQQNRSAPAQRAHAFGLVQVQQGKTVGTAQALVGALYAMAIGIRLDHGPNAGVASGLADLGQVVAQGFGVDSGLYRTGHGRCAESFFVLWHQSPAAPVARAVFEST